MVVVVVVGGVVGDDTVVAAAVVVVVDVDVVAAAVVVADFYCMGEHIYSSTVSLVVAAVGVVDVFVFVVVVDPVGVVVGFYCRSISFECGAAYCELVVGHQSEGQQKVGYKILLCVSDPAEILSIEHHAACPG